MSELGVLFFEGSATNCAGSRIADQGMADSICYIFRMAEMQVLRVHERGMVHVPRYSKGITIMALVR